MLGRVFLMDCKRCFQPARMLVVIVITVIFIILDQIDMITQFLDYPYGTIFGSLDFLNLFLSYDKYKVVIAVLLGTLYTSSFCKDVNTNYLRSILARVDVTTYVRARILSNTAVIVVTTVLGFFAYVLVILPKYPLLNLETPLVMGYVFYETIFSKYPLLFVLMAGVQMGMYTAVCSSIGIVFSSYQSNAFVSIGLTGLCFFMGLSYLPHNTPINMLSLVSLNLPSAWFENFPPLFSYFWGIFLESMLLCVCGYWFYRRMKWRVANGII